MTLDELLDLLEHLPASARTARVEVTDSNFDCDVLAVNYEMGVVRLTVDEMEREDADEGEPDDDE